MHVRLATSNDMHGIASITNDAILRTAGHFATEAQAVESISRAWSNSREMYPWLVSIVDRDGAGPDKVLGYTKATEWNSRCAYTWTVETSVYVRPDQHRKGIGRALYSRLFELLRLQGYRTLIGGITLPNDASVALHEAMGMRQVAHFERVGHKMGRWRDVGYWQLVFERNDEAPTALVTVAEAADHTERVDR